MFKSSLFKLLVIVVVIFVAGSFGYYLIEDNWTLFDGFYMTAISITTVGYGETKPLSDSGRLFTIFLIFSGLGSAAVFATQLAKAFIENHFQKFLGESKMLKKINKMQNHYLICGFGEIGSSICSSLDDSEIPFVVIEESEEGVKWAKQRNYLAINGKSTYDSTLIQAGIKKAAGIVISMGDDSLNMYVSLAARELNPDIYIITRGYKSDIESRLLRAGADKIVYPIKMGGEQIAKLIKGKIDGSELESDIGSLSSSLMGYSLKVYKHFRSEPNSISSICRELNADTVLAYINEDGIESKNFLNDQLIYKDESLVLVLNSSTQNRSDLGIEKESLFVWSEEFCSGIPSIDAEHQKLFEIADEFVRAVKSGLNKDYLARIFDRLIEYTIEHFENEEKLLDKYNYPQVLEHKAEHKRLTEKVLELNHNRNYIFSESVEGFLFDWLKHHIFEEDMKFVDYVNSVGK